MRNRILYFLLLALVGVISSVAQDELGTKILVFRNTGEINVFNTSEISRIVLSNIDADSIEHDDYISQVFYQTDSVFTVVPIVEIDSVAFGVRNAIEPKPFVRKLTDEEVACISYFDDDRIEYVSGLTLEEGEIVYYDEMTDILPYGLCARIGVVNNDGNGYVASMEFLEPEEVFDRYLITGEDAMTNGRLRKLDYSREPLKIEIPETEIEGYTIKGHISTTAHLDFEDGVCDFVKGYYHGKLKLSISPEIQFSVLSADSGELSDYHGVPIQFNVPFLGGALNAGITAQLFSDFNAEAGIEYSYNSELYVETEWTRQNGKNEFKPISISENSGTSVEQKIEVHLKGELFFGPAFRVQIGALFNRVGAGAEIKIGPKFEADFSLGAIQSLSEEYNEEIYGNAKIECSLGAKMETYTFVNHSLFGDEDRTKLPFESEIFFPIDTFELFPEFTSRAVLGKDTSHFVMSADTKDAVSVSSYTETPLPFPIELGIELAEIDSEKPFIEVDLEEIVETVENVEDGFQNINTEIILPDEITQEQKERIEVRPILYYKGYKVHAKPFKVASDMVFSPVIASFCSNGAYFVSGMTPVSQHTYDDEITLIEGNHVGITQIDERLKGKRTFTVIDFVDLSDLLLPSGSLNTSHHLLGNWAGLVMVDQVSLHFIDEKTGRLNDEFFTYQFNSPLNGSIAVQMGNGSTANFSILELDSTHMTIVPKGSVRSFFLTRY